MTPEAARDDAELRLRMLPGVLTVGFEATSDGHPAVVLTIAEGAEPIAVGEEAAVIVAAIPAAGLRITPARFPVSPAHRLRKQILDIEGVLDCKVELRPGGGIDGLEVDVDSIAAVQSVSDLVTCELGEAFTRRHLRFEFHLATSRTAPSGG